MARTNISTTRVKPESTAPLTLRVLRSARVSEHVVRVTLGGGDIGRFGYMGFDQWFRLFLPVSDDSLRHVPQKLTTLSYVKLLTTSKATRPVVRNYSVRAYRAEGPDGAELDVDFVLHGSGTAATWAQGCVAGDRVAILDEGIGFNPPTSLEHVLLVADESGMPAAAGVLGSLPDHFRGQALLEVPAADDRQELVAPDGVEVTWIVREDPHAVPGRAALAAAQAVALPAEPFYGWTVGEQSLPTGLRRHWVAAGVPKEHIVFCGYWRAKG